MSADSELQEAHLHLKEAVASGKLSAPLQDRATEILRRIEQPIRLGVFGLPKSGKSTLLNLLLGSNIIPDGIQLPTVQFSHGDDPHAICTLGNGAKQTVGGQDMHAVVGLNPAFIEAFYPLPALKKLSMLEVVAGANPVEQKRAIQWAAKRIDIALWCTAEHFGTNEQDLWQYMPERVQNHAFLILTKTDSPHSQAHRDKRVNQAKSNGRDFFKTVLPIGTKTAVAARKPDGTVDKDALRQSGGIALISAILRDVEAGKQSALDQAVVFLGQIDFKPKQKHITVVPTAPPPVDPVAEKTETIEIEVKKYLSPISRAALEQAVEQLAVEGEAMIKGLSAGQLDDAQLLETCVDTVSWLADYLSQSGEDNDLVYTQNRDAALDAADLIQLIQLESGDSVTSDALSLMVQLKQEMQASLAA